MYVCKCEDPGLALVRRSYNYIHNYGYKSKLLSAVVPRFDHQDSDSILTLSVILSLGVDYVIAPLKVLQSLKDSPSIQDD